MRLYQNKQLLIDSIRNIKEGMSDTSIYLYNNHAVSSDDLSVLWEHAKPHPKRIKRYALETADFLGEPDIEEADLTMKNMTNVRCEENVIYDYDGSDRQKTSSMVVKVCFLDRQMNESYYLLYIPLSRWSNKRAIRIYQNRSVADRILPLESRSQMKAEYVELAQPTDELALVEGPVMQGIQLMIKNNTPTWVFFNKSSLENIKLPPLYKIEIYLPFSYDGIIEQMNTIFKDRCELLHVALWNRESLNYKWVIDDPDTDYLGTGEAGEAGEQGNVG